MIVIIAIVITIIFAGGFLPFILTKGKGGGRPEPERIYNIA